MRLFRRWPLVNRFASWRCIPKLEALEDRSLPAAGPLFGQFQSALGLLSLHGDSAHHLVTASLSTTGFLQVHVGTQVATSDPHSTAYDPALAGATAQTLQAIQFDGSAGLDHLVLGNLTVGGGLTVQSDGILDVQGQVSAAGPIQLCGETVQLGGQVRADGATGGNITVTAGNVLQSGLLEADGTQGNGGAITVDFSGHYLATVSALTAANSTGTGTGSGGLVVIDGFSTGTFFSSGRYQANAGQGGQGGEIDLFAEQVRLVGAHIDASGPAGGGWVRVGGDSPSDIAAHGGSAAGVSYADITTVTATTTLTANALSAGNGGRIVVWSQNTTTFGGTLAAQGAGATGTGGLLEVSSAGQLTYGGHATATASSGKQGRLLLDPKNLIISAGAGLPKFNLVNPETDGLDSFGSSIVVLSNGNVVVTDPASNLVAANAGAVYLFDGQTGALLGTLTGSTSGDEVGSGGITVLNNGNFVVSSPLWQGVGAATWIDGSTGFTASVSAANSLIGSTSGDQVGNTVTALANGNYVVASPGFQDGTNIIIGAVTWGDGANGTFGAVNATNSLVGSTGGDDVGNDGVTALTNGNYVVSSGSWQNPNGSAGAATWGNGAGGTIGPVSAANSLVGAFSYSGDVGTNVTALSDGNYVVSSPGWNPDDIFIDSAVGAATWGNGSTGTVGVVSVSNSLIGATGFDNVAGGGVTALTNGNYVVISPSFQDGTANYIGAVTWGAAGGGTVGVVSASNSLLGSTNGDGVGSGGVIALSNGSYVVATPGWQNAGTAVVGAVTWGAANGSTIGTISASNSLLGTHDGDAVGSGGVTALSNGNYVVSSPNWQNGPNVVGAVTLAQADGSTVGSVSVSNSLVGSTSNDDVGSGGVTALSNGAYVVSSPKWQIGVNVVVGAVTLGHADGSTIGPVSGSNSLVGSTNKDDVGSGGVTVLSNGNYLISSPDWHQVGAVTWINGSTGLTMDGTNATNVIDAANSLIGAGSGALLGQVVGLQGGGSFLANFSGHGGAVIVPPAVTVVQLTPQSETFATASTLTLTLSPSFLTETLDTGTAVVLQASNDITVEDPILVNNPTGNGGDLTLQAGRNIFIFASITTDNGNLTIHANDTAADGVVNSERDGNGTAAITMTPGTSLNAGTGNVTVMEDTGAGNSNFASDDLTLGDIVGNNVTLLNYGLGDGSIGGVSPGGGADMASVTGTGNLTVYATFDISQSGALSPTDPDIINVAGTTSLTATGTPLAFILLNNPANVFGGTVTYSDPGRDVEIAASGNLTLASATTAASLTATAGGTLTSTGPLAVSGQANLTGATITLTDSQNDFGGVVSLTSSGAIALTDAAALTLGSPDILGGSLTLAGPTTLTAPSISFIGNVNVGAQTLTLNSTTPVDLNSDTTIAGGTISDSSGLIVGNGGTLSGSGILQVGVGSAGVTVQDGGTVSPDLTPAGLTVNGDLTLSSGSILAEQIQSATQFAELNVNGAINLGNGTLQLAFLSPYQPAAFTQFQILNNTPGTAITGAFAQGTSVAAGSNVLGIDYAGGIGNNVVLTVQGPPASVSALPPVISVTSFTVSWSGTEYAAGASAFNVYVSDDNGPFTLWQSDTTQTSAIFTGQFGHTYSFFSVYTDDAANTTPASQASTTPKESQTINFSISSPVIVGVPLTLSATGGASGNSVTFSLISGPATMILNTLVANGIGTIVVEADQAGNSAFTAAQPVQSSVVVNSTYTFTATPETANGTPTAVAISTVLKNHFGDADKTNKPGIAITELLGAGVWQYFNGAAWANITGVSETNALLLPQTDKLRFVPTGLQPDSADLLFNAWDGSLGTIGGRANVTNRGGGTPFSTNAGLLTVNVTAVTAAPVWLATTTPLTPAAPGGTNAGESVQQAFGALFSGDNGQQPGIAIVGVTGTTSGAWQYALYNSNTQSFGSFQNLGTVSASAARLLGAQDLIRFVPTSATFIGSVTLQARAWDGSTGSDGGTVNLSKTTSIGAKTAFSSTVLTAKLTFNHAPTQNATAGIPLTATAENAISKTVTVASLLKDAGALDSDKGTALGLALTSAAGPGTWQYQLSSAAAWQMMPATVSASSALLLPATATLRFVPTTNQSGSATLSWAAWDGTQGTAGTQAFAIPSPSGGATAFSSNIASATLTVTPSQTTPPPAWSGTGAAFTPVVPNTPLTDNTGDTVASVFSSYFEAAPGSSVGIAISAVTGTTSGTWYYSLDGTTWVSLNTVTSTKAVLLARSDLIRFVPKITFLGGTVTLTAHAWDAVPSKAGTTVNLLLKGATGGTSGIGTGTLAALCLVNTAPTLM